MDENQNQTGGNAPAPDNSVPAPIPNPTTTSGESGPNQPASAFIFTEQTIMAALSYVGPLVLVPFLTKKEDSFIYYHVKQGMLVFGIYVAVWLLSGWLFFLYPILSLVAIVFSLFGIYNALKHTEKELPFIGHYASHIKI